jgi:hypothetical protein
MLIIDAPEFDEIEVEEMISERCSEFGSVMAVEIRRDSDPHHYDLAFVEMSTREQLSGLVQPGDLVSLNPMMVRKICSCKLRLCNPLASRP